MKPFRDAIREQVLILDGAMGTMLQEGGLKAGLSPEERNLTMPEVVASVHRDYIAAGADIIITNTFGGSRFKLAHYGLEGRLAEINARAVEIARAEAGGKAYVGASIGPTGQFVEPLGEVAFDEMKAAFREQAEALVNAGADLISLETFLDIKECRAAVIAIREVSRDIPVIAMLTFDDNGRSVLGTPPEAAAITLTAAGADLVGSNCGLGVDGIYDILCRMRGATPLPLISQANAGLPQLIDGKTIFPGTPEEMTAYHERMISLGVRVIGGCCGTTPAHLLAMRRALEAVERAAASRGGVLVCGERGSGRAMLAREIHDRGAGADAPFVRLNCSERAGDDLEAAIFGVVDQPRGGSAERRRVERVTSASALGLARGGTLYLAHLADASERVQARLTRVLRDGEVNLDDSRRASAIDLRVIASAGSGWEPAVQDGRVRDDLARRVGACRVNVPPLRERRDDLPQLAAVLLDKVCRGQGIAARSIDPAALALLAALPWRGNGPEMEAVLGAVARHAPGPSIRIEHVLASVSLDSAELKAPASRTLREARAAFERGYIVSALEHHHGRIPDAARSLGLQRTNLYRKMRVLQIAWRSQGGNGDNGHGGK
jgi:methionine synthase I (cobalamin-dependent)